MTDWGRSLSKWKERHVSAFRRSFPVSATLGATGFIIGILGGAASLVDSFKANTTYREWVLSVTLALTTIVALAVLGKREMELGRQSKYVATLHQQERVTELLRDLRIYLRRFGPNAEQPTREVLARSQQMIEEILTIYAQIFSSLISARCRMCVKLVQSTQQRPSIDDFLVYTLGRDAISRREEDEHDQSRYRDRSDKLKDNSDFLSLFAPKAGDDSYFLSNDLSKETNYQTSSWNYRMMLAGGPNKSHGNRWLLWYRSTIVWPVRRDRRADLGITDPVCLGFVTVDSHVTGAFLSHEHAPLGKMLANALYPILDHYIFLDGMIASQRETKL